MSMLNTQILILLTMLFCHIIDDYYLQGILASMKQKDWWNKNAPDKLYKYDYIVALFMHSLSWTFSIHIPLIIYTIINKTSLCLILFTINLVIHMIVDDLKANKKKINLIVDQLIHIIQIIVTWLIYIS